MSLADKFKLYMIKNEKVDTLPRLEIMPYNEATIERWRNEGLPNTVKTQAEFHDYFGLSRLDFFFIWPDIDNVGCRGKISTSENFASVKSSLYDLEKVRVRMHDYRQTLDIIEEANGIMWIPLHGYFWHPRDLFGVAEHLMMFYDNPVLMQDINKSLLEFNIGVVNIIYEVGIPTIICVSEDLAYKNGAMISKELFDEFIAPYHQELLKEIKKEFCIAALDSDGDITNVTCWFAELGYDCINPIERQTGMDLIALREKNPNIAFLGGYNKLVMSKGPEAIHSEFESLKSVFLKGKFVPAVDHQTPPEVSLDNYRHYLNASEKFFSEMGVA